MSGSKFEDTPLGPLYAGQMAVTKAVTQILLDAGMCPAKAGFVAWRAAQAVLETIDDGWCCSIRGVAVAELLKWGGIGDGEAYGADEPDSAIGVECLAGE